MVQLTAATACLVLLSACDTGPRQLRLVVPTEPVDAAILEDLGTLLNAHGTVELQPTTSPMPELEALETVAAGRADIALISNNLPFRSDIATVMPLYPTVLHIGRRVALDDTDGLEFLRNAAIYAGEEGSASRLVFERVAARMDIGSDEYRYVDNLAGDFDAFVVFAPISPDRIEEIRRLHADFSDFTLSSMGTPTDIGKGSIIDAAVLMNPQFRPFVLPIGTYGVLSPEPVVTVAVDKMLVTRNDVDEAVIYDLVNEILRMRPALSARRPGLFQQLEDDFDVSRSTYLVHAGTQAYLQRSAPTIYERYSGIAEVAVTVLIGLASALLGLLRFLKIRRKNRIDTFYVQTIALRRSVDETTSDEERQRVVDAVRDLQANAFDLLVDEKLAANESFRIFITLSNDVLRQLGEAEAIDRPSDA